MYIVQLRKLQYKLRNVVFKYKLDTFETVR